MTTGTRKPGQFCFINMLSPKPAEACAFFAKVLGWTYDDIPGLGYSVNVGGRNVGGLFDTVSPRTPNGTAPTIGVMVKVESADATSAKSAALGGKGEAAFDVMESGRMAVCFDPTGANIDVWQPKKRGGMEVNTSLHGAPSWFEVLTTDTARCTAFYSQWFGWTHTVTPTGAFDYTTFALDGEPVAGMMAITPDMPPMKPHWGVYFTVDDVDATATVAAAAGGTVELAPRDIPGVGRFCGIVSPQGVVFYAITYSA